MSERTTLARPYAKAIFEIAKSAHSYEKWSKFFSVLTFAVQDRRVADLLKDRTISVKKRIDFCLELCEALNISDNFVRNFVKLLIVNHRLALVSEMETLYEEFRRIDAKQSIVEFMSPIPLSETEKGKYTKLLEKYLSSSVTIDFQVNKNLLGGFVARAGNIVIDGSLRGNLENLKEAMGG